MLLKLLLLTIYLANKSKLVSAENYVTSKMTSTEKQNLYLDLFKNVGYGEPLRRIPGASDMPELTKISELCPKNGFFFSFNPNHMAAVGRLKSILAECSSIQNLFSMAKILRDHPKINYKVWIYAITSYIYNHPEMQGITKVAPWQLTPDVFFPAEILEKACQLTGIGSERCTILDEKTTADNGIESILWYFREDILLNAHHWYWHAIYLNRPPMKLDRAGELFYYFHHGALARYNSERFSHGLKRTREFDVKVGGIIQEGYNAHLRDDISGYNWTPRQPNTPLMDIDRLDENAGNDYVTSNVRNIVKAQDRINAAIRNGSVIAKNGTAIPLKNFQGIDILSDIVVAINYSVNPDFYGINPGGLHNNGHRVLGYATDPRHLKHLPPGVMSDFAPAMRDIIFYPWHETINGIFESHKATLKPYQLAQGEFPLVWGGVTLQGLKVIMTKFHGSRDTNILETFWKYRNIKLVHGLDFYRNKSKGAVHICVKHLNHQEFTYEIEINNKNPGPNSKATVRTFMAPRFKEDGTQFAFNEQRRFFFAMDSFTTTLKKGTNTIARNSVDSTVTIPWQDAYNELQMDDNTETPVCGCGWPHNLLLPKGTPTGMTFDLFAIITNDNDAVPDNEPRPGTCTSAPVYCGVINQKYPDPRPMGYPIDRIPYNFNPTPGRLDKSTLADFVNNIPNMAAIKVTIFHHNAFRN